VSLQFFHIKFKTRHRDRYHTDPSGSYWETSAKAIGAGMEGADAALNDQYNRVISSLLLTHV
jgi:20S proteasome alpha/beta subunit